jgi:toxin ParE1/3/4
VNRVVSFSPEAKADLLRLYDYKAYHSGTERALSYTDRIREYCMSFADFPERGTGRDDLWPGLRTVGFEKRVAIAFHVTADTVIIDRVLYGGRDLESAMSEDG